MVRLVVVHGRDQHYEIPATLRREWEEALRFGLERAKAPYAQAVDVSFSFYGDLWRPDAGDAERSGARATRPSGQPSQVQRALAADLLSAAPGSRAGPRARATDDAGPDRLGWDNLAGLIATLDARFGVGRRVLEWFLTDVDDYFRVARLRRDAQGRLTKALRAAGPDVVLVAHSMGSIVGYDLLNSAAGTRLPLRALVTFGSPLGLPSMRAALAGHGGRTPFPAPVDRWINVFNRKDFATVVRDLAPLYPSSNERKVEGKEAKGRDPGLTSPTAAHDAKVYLSSVAMGQALRALLDDSMGHNVANGERGATERPVAAPCRARLG